MVIKQATLKNAYLRNETKGLEYTLGIFSFFESRIKIPHYKKLTKVNKVAGIAWTLTEVTEGS